MGPCIQLTQESLHTVDPKVYGCHYGPNICVYVVGNKTIITVSLFTAKGTQLRNTSTLLSSALQGQLLLNDGTLLLLVVVHIATQRQQHSELFLVGRPKEAEVFRQFTLEMGTYMSWKVSVVFQKNKLLKNSVVCLI